MAAILRQNFENILRDTCKISCVVWRNLRKYCIAEVADAIHITEKFMEMFFHGRNTRE